MMPFEHPEAGTAGYVLASALVAALVQQGVLDFERLAPILASMEADLLKAGRRDAAALISGLRDALWETSRPPE